MLTRAAVFIDWRGCMTGPWGPGAPGNGIFNRSEALDTNLTKWSPPVTTMALPPGVSKVQDPSRAVQLHDGHWYVAGACDVSTEYTAICLFRATDSTLSKLEPAGSSTGIFFKIPSTLGAIDSQGVFHNISYPLQGLDAGCPDLFPCGEKMCLIVTYGGPPGRPGPNDHSHMQDQWWSGTIDETTMQFIPEETGLLDYGNLFAAKTGSVENQAGTSRRVVFGFPGWTQSTKPREAVNCLQFPRELTFVENRLHVSPIAEMDLLRNPKTKVSCSNCKNKTALAGGAQIEIRLSAASGHPSTRAQRFGGLQGAVGADVLVSPDGSQYTRIVYDFHQQKLLVDQRACCGESPGNGVVQNAPIVLANGEDLELAVFVDGYLIEVFMNNRTVITAEVAPDEAVAAGPQRKASVFTTNPALAVQASSWQTQL